MKIIFNLEAEEDCFDLSISAKSLEPYIRESITAGKMSPVKRARLRYTTRIVSYEKPYIVEFALHKDARNNDDEKLWVIQIQQVTIDDIETIGDKDIAASSRK